MHEMLMYTAEMKSQTSQPWQLKAAKVWPVLLPGIIWTSVLLWIFRAISSWNGNTLRGVPSVFRD